MWILALEVGTSSIRAVGYDAAGRALPAADARVGYEPATTPDGGSELDAEELVAATASAVDRCLAAAPGPPGAVAGSVFWHSLLALDAGGRPLTGVITWADTRSASAAKALRARLDETAAHARTGAPLHSTFFPAKLTWLRETRPEVFARAATWCGFAEYLLLRFTVHLRASVSMASGTGLLDQRPDAWQRAGAWDAPMLDACGIGPERLPPIDDTAAVGLTPASSARWPDLVAVPWLPAAGDGACSNLGADCSGPGRIALNVGTSAALRLVTDAPRAVPWGLWHYRVDARRHLIGGATSEGGNVVAWARRTLALPAADGALDVALAAVPPDSHGLTALPFLAGERSPGWRGDARAAVTGVSLATTAPQILRALVEAVAYRLAAVYDRLRPLAAPGHAVIASGGALGHSRAWAQILADALGGADRGSGGHGGLEPRHGAPGPGAARLPGRPRPSRRALQYAPTLAVATSTRLRGPARTACTPALWGHAYLEKIGGRDSKPMRIAIGCDDTGFPLKERVAAALEASGHVLLDLGTFSTDPVDYPDYARAVGQAVLRGFADAGVLICGSGAGASIAANKIRGVRASLCHDPEAARLSREEDDANVLCLGAREVDGASAVNIAAAWLAASFSGDARFVRKVSKVALLEGGLPSLERGAAGAPADAPRAGPPGGADKPHAAARIEMEEPGAAAVAAQARPVDEAFKLPIVQETMDVLEGQDFLNRLWVKDASLWKGETAAIRDRLGWLTSPTIMRGHADEIKAFADEIRRLQFNHVVLLGMGGSSLCADLFNVTFGSKMGYPDFLLLDSTDPAAVKHTLDRLNLTRTLFIVATKSGTTAETMYLYHYFRGQVEASTVPRAGIHFVAITDPGGPLDKLAAEWGFRRTFLNPASIGGRYSALSFFGLVPAALIGIDIKALLDRSHAMAETCGIAVGARDNAAVRLGAALAGLAKAGRDKVTLVLSRKLRGLGPWIEQLLAESLGKDGKGLVPVDDEPLGPPAVYGEDRVFVALTLEGDTSHDAALNALEDAGHPVIRISLREPLEVGAEFFRWEVATAAAGVVLGVNPFDEPDVTRAKENTSSLLGAWKKSKKLPEWPADAEENGLALTTNSGTKPAGVSQGLQAFLGQAQPGDYIAIQAYLAPTADTWSRLQELRTLLRDRLTLATTVAFGPRYLHSTGQMHKGGRPNGLFIQLTGEDKEDMAIPGAGYGFSTLKAAQALGDLQALRDAGRRVGRVHLSGKQTQGVEQLIQVLQKALKKK